MRLHTLAGFLLLSLVGCWRPSQTAPVVEGPTILIEHAWGETEVPLKPQRIVVLDLPFLDAMTALEQPVAGYAGTSDQKVPEYLGSFLTESPDFVGERKQPNLEVILSLNPQLIVANPDRHKMVRPYLETIAPTIALTDDSLDEVRQMVRTFGRITQREQQANELLKQLRSDIKEVAALQKGQPTVLLVGAFEDEFTTWTSGSFIGSLFQELGAVYLFTGPPTASESQTEVAKITVENLAALDPDYLFLYGSDERWRGNPIYEGLSARRHQQILPVSRDLWSRSRGPLAAKAIVRMVADFLQSRGT